jgi:hypothetical protein
MEGPLGLNIKTVLKLSVTKTPRQPSDLSQIKFGASNSGFLLTSTISLSKPLVMNVTAAPTEFVKIKE